MHSLFHRHKPAYDIIMLVYYSPKYSCLFLSPFTSFLSLRENITVLIFACMKSLTCFVYVRNVNRKSTGFLSVLKSHLLPTHTKSVVIFFRRCDLNSSSLHYGQRPFPHPVLFLFKVSPTIPLRPPPENAYLYASGASPRDMAAL